MEPAAMEPFHILAIDRLHRCLRGQLAVGAVVAEQQCRQDASGLAIRILLGSGYPGQDLLLESVEVLRGKRRMQHHVGEYSQRRKQRGLECRKRHNAGFTATAGRSEEHTSELQSLMRISYAVFC